MKVFVIFLLNQALKSIFKPLLQPTCTLWCSEYPTYCKNILFFIFLLHHIIWKNMFCGVFRALLRMCKCMLWCQIWISRLAWREKTKKNSEMLHFSNWTNFEVFGLFLLKQTLKSISDTIAPTYLFIVLIGTLHMPIVWQHVLFLFFKNMLQYRHVGFWHCWTLLTLWCPKLVFKASKTFLFEKCNQYIGGLKLFLLNQALKSIFDTTAQTYLFIALLWIPPHAYNATMYDFSLFFYT